MIRPEIAKAIEETVAPAMRRMGYQGLRMEEGENHAGEPVIWVHVDYAAEGDPIDSKVTADLVYRLRLRLLALDEERFPHIRHHFDEQQKVLGYA